MERAIDQVASLPYLLNTAYSASGRQLDRIIHVIVNNPTAQVDECYYSALTLARKDSYTQIAVMTPRPVVTPGRMTAPTDWAELAEKMARGLHRFARGPAGGCNRFAHGGCSWACSLYIHPSISWCSWLSREFNTLKVPDPQTGTVGVQIYCADMVFASLLHDALTSEPFAFAFGPLDLRLPTPALPAHLDLAVLRAAGVISAPPTLPGLSATSWGEYFVYSSAHLLSCVSFETPWYFCDPSPFFCSRAYPHHAAPATRCDIVSRPQGFQTPRGYPLAFVTASSRLNMVPLLLVLLSPPRTRPGLPAPSPDEIDPSFDPDEVLAAIHTYRQQAIEKEQPGFHGTAAALLPVLICGHITPAMQRLLRSPRVPVPLCLEGDPQPSPVFCVLWERGLAMAPDHRNPALLVFHCRLR
ncbi:hypothetical protein PAPYR_6226 [Paratrimastix pyriformis]|uniref:Uncharacterized protein n=1 Tax=Paratrimastix pyriformis TaxID=342808 RepID=A0ABQ8UFR6_9EUKA|nr:hypothetical protein PAPYR_6226 [Paratrimastix pyriformis]